jgi:hypothetical protein
LSSVSDEKGKEKTGDCALAYFFSAALGAGFGAAFAGAALAPVVVSFMGAPQQTTSHGLQSHALSTTSTTPQLSHSYLSPFFAISSHLQSISENTGI